MVSISKDGPYAVTGGIELLDTKMRDGAWSEHFAALSAPRRHPPARPRGHGRTRPDRAKITVIVADTRDLRAQSIR
jgi:hypothetical protein